MEIIHNIDEVVKCLTLDEKAYLPQTASQALKSFVRLVITGQFLRKVSKTGVVVKVWNTRVSKPIIMPAKIFRPVHRLA